MALALGVVVPMPHFVVPAQKWAPKAAWPLWVISQDVSLYIFSKFSIVVECVNHPAGEIKVWIFNHKGHKGFTKVAKSP